MKCLLQCAEQPLWCKTQCNYNIHVHLHQTWHVQYTARSKTHNNYNIHSSLRQWLKRPLQYAEQFSNAKFAFRYSFRPDFHHCARKFLNFPKQAVHFARSTKHTRFIASSCDRRKVWPRASSGRSTPWFVWRGCAMANRIHICYKLREQLHDFFEGAVLGWASRPTRLREW